MQRLGFDRQASREQTSPRRHIEQKILEKYTDIPDLERKRMVLDLMNFLEEKATHIRSQSDQRMLPKENIGNYELDGRKPLKFVVEGNASYKNVAFQDLYTRYGWEALCKIDVDIKYQSPDPSQRFEEILKDISKLSGLMPPDYDSESPTPFHGPRPKYKAVTGWCDGKTSLDGRQDPNGWDCSSFHFSMDEDKIPAFLTGVRLIKAALHKQVQLHPTALVQQIA